MTETARKKGRGRAAICIGAFLLGQSYLPVAWSKEGNESCRLPDVDAGGRIDLDPQCVYTAPLRITRSNTFLDCHGATIDGRGKASRGIRIGSTGVTTDVTVRHCRIRGVTGHAILIRWERSPREVNQLAREEAWRLAPQRILIENVILHAPPRAGVYVAEYARNVTIRNVTFEHFGHLGIYLDYSSQHNVVEKSQFLAGPTPPTREAIAIDSSAYNAIRDNTFVGPMPAGILLYRNCQERIRSDPDSPFRWQSSEHNTIIGNTFKAMNVGVSLASRQSRDLSSWACGNPSYGNGKYYRDWAPDNLVSENTFQDVNWPIIVQDDNNTITNNRIAGARSCVRVGSKPRSELLGKPVVGTVMSGNTCRGVVNPAQGYRFMYGADRSKFGTNTVDGKLVAPGDK